MSPESEKKPEGIEHSISNPEQKGETFKKIEEMLQEISSAMDDPKFRKKIEEIPQVKESMSSAQEAITESNPEQQGETFKTIEEMLQEISSAMDDPKFRKKIEEVTEETTEEIPGTNLMKKEEKI